MFSMESECRQLKSSIKAIKKVNSENCHLLFLAGILSDVDGIVQFVLEYFWNF